MTAVLLAPAALQAFAMLVDEGWFHRRRGLPRWERWGHPLDALSTAACYAWLITRRTADPRSLYVYAALAATSCLFITKDEFVHARLCRAAESWLHALLFVVHPIVFLTFWVLWRAQDGRGLLLVQLALTLSFAVYQLVYWSIPWKRTRSAQ